MDGSTGGRLVVTMEGSDWVRSSPSIDLRLVMLLPTTASMLSLLMLDGPEESHRAYCDGPPYFLLNKLITTKTHFCSNKFITVETL